MEGVSLLATILGIVGFAGGAAGYFAKSRGDTIISLQGKEIEYWKDRATQFEKDNAKLIVERDTLKQQNDKLWQRAQGVPQLKELTAQIKELVVYIKNGGSK